MNPTTVELAATILFALGIIHTFLASKFAHLAHQYPEHSVRRNTFHLLGEVEAVFGFWAALLVCFIAISKGTHAAVEYVESRAFIEPAFVFVIMTVASTKPVIDFANSVILLASRVIPLPREVAVYIACLVLGPLMGSFITEPAAMTVTALILKHRFYDRGLSDRLKYLTLGVLFVNVSIGGVLTPYAAPPVLMVAGKWNWDTAFMMSHFGWKAALACSFNAVLSAVVNFKELKTLSATPPATQSSGTPFWLIAVHLAFLALIVLNSHHMAVFIGIFLFFMGVTSITRKYQSELSLRGSLMVAFFLGGLIILGGLQQWWLEPLLKKMSSLVLFLGCTGLTAITDNAALTYLGSQVSNPTFDYQYALVAGAVAGGGLTVIANAPNPAGYSILQDRFGDDGISALKLFLYASVPTLIAMACLWLTPR
jgi:hypothetical protein